MRRTRALRAPAVRPGRQPWRKAGRRRSSGTRTPRDGLVRRRTPAVGAVPPAGRRGEVICPQAGGVGAVGARLCGLLGRRFQLQLLLLLVLFLARRRRGARVLILGGCGDDFALGGRGGRRGGEAGAGALGRGREGRGVLEGGEGAGDVVCAVFVSRVLAAAAAYEA